MPSSRTAFVAVVLLLAASKLWGGVGDGTTSPVADRTDAKLAGRARAPAVNDNTFSAVAERFNLGSVLRRVAVNNTVVVTTASKDFERYVVRWCDIGHLLGRAFAPTPTPRWSPAPTSALQRYRLLRSGSDNLQFVVSAIAG